MATSVTMLSAPTMLGVALESVGGSPSRGEAVRPEGWQPVGAEGQVGSGRIMQVREALRPASPAHSLTGLRLCHRLHGLARALPKVPLPLQALPQLLPELRCGALAERLGSGGATAGAPRQLRRSLLGSGGLVAGVSAGAGGVCCCLAGANSRTGLLG